MSATPLPLLLHCPDVAVSRSHPPLAALAAALGAAMRADCDEHVRALLLRVHGPAGIRLGRAAAAGVRPAVGQETEDREEQGVDGCAVDRGAERDEGVDLEVQAVWGDKAGGVCT